MSDKKQLIIITAARLFHQKGYHHVGIKQILDEVNIPKGSFYHYFDSKESLALAIIEFYITDTNDIIAASPDTMEGIQIFCNTFFERLKSMELKSGCPVGNLILELSDDSEPCRLKLEEWYLNVETWVHSIASAHAINDPTDYTKALLSAFEGTMMIAKLTKRIDYFASFNQIFFKSLIQKTAE